MRTALLIVALAFCACCKSKEGIPQPIASASAAPATASASPAPVGSIIRSVPADIDLTDTIVALVADPSRYGLSLDSSTADTETFSGAVAGMGKIELRRLKSKKSHCWLSINEWVGNADKIVLKGSGKLQPKRAKLVDTWLMVTGPLGGTAVSLSALPGSKLFLLTTEAYQTAKGLPFP